MSAELWDLLTSNPWRATSGLATWDGATWERRTWATLVDEATAMAVGLRRAGVRPGARVATVLTNSYESVRGLAGAWFAGATVVSLPVPARGADFGAYLRRTAELCRDVESPGFFTDSIIAAAIGADGLDGVPVHSWGSFAGSGARAIQGVSGPQPALIQYSSGSTGEHKGCALTVEAIAAQLRIIMAMLEAEPGGETCAAWLPLSHDMGLFGTLLTTWAYDEDLYLSSPERFMASPRTWFADMAELGATVSAGTNTALAVATRAQRQRLSKPLAVHSIILGAERLDATTFDRALDVFGPDGLTATALMPAYGLAEATLAVTATPRSEPPRSVVVDSRELADGRVRIVEEDHPHAARLISAGEPCEGVRLEMQPGDALQEIVVRSPALSSGYHGAPDATAERFRDGAVLTRDLGFVRDGHLYPVGRMDDILIVGGRNVYAREIELAVDGLEGARRGCATLVDVAVDDAACLVLLLETRTDDPEQRRAIAEGASDLALRLAGVALDACLFLPADTLPKTPSGKIQRFRCRESLRAGTLVPEHVADLTGRARALEEVGVVVP